MKNLPPKTLVILGLTVAASGIWYIKHKEKEQAKEEFIPVQGPKTYYGSQEAAGNFGNFGGGGAPSSPAPTGTIATPPEKHAPEKTPGPKGCPEGTHTVGISAVAGQPGGIRCI